MLNKEKVHAKIHECVGISLEANEELYLVVRKHWIILVWTFFFLLMLGVLCIWIYFIGMFSGIPIIFILLTMIGLTMIGLQYIFVQWVNQELDLLIVTNRRIITLDQVKFLDRNLSQTTIDLVQEVSASTAWLFGNILSYGSIMIRTASDTSNTNSDFQITRIPNPMETSRQIHNFIDEYRHSLDTNSPSWQK